MHFAKKVATSSLASVSLILMMVSTSLLQASSARKISIRSLKEFEKNYKLLFAENHFDISNIIDKEELEDAEQLNTIIQGKKGIVCSPLYIDRLSQYYNKRIANRHKTLNANKLENFFALYAKQVTLTCKKLALNRLVLAQIEDSNIVEALDRLIELEISTPLYQRQPTSQYNVATNMENIIYLDDLMKQNSYHFGNVELSNYAMLRLAQLREDCLLLQPHYAYTILPVARLASMGFVVADDKIDFQLQGGASTIERWLMATATCQMVNRIHIDRRKLDNDKANFLQEETNWIVSLTLKRKVQYAEQHDYYVRYDLYQDDFDELDSSIIDGQTSTTWQKLKQFLVCGAAAADQTSDSSSASIGNDYEDGDCVNIIYTTIKAIIKALKRELGHS